ncbi:hypothetical protein [Paenibacillus pseudetheri]|uniref:hypothetical protein n=1 Tax=Paenibacillus pseudetheri TaxID=2897682 RepID=UPI001F21391B|nr:hypothetical protein [Paenibacillus pseudetheri]
MPDAISRVKLAVIDHLVDSAQTGIQMPEVLAGVKSKKHALMPNLVAVTINFHHFIVIAVSRRAVHWSKNLNRRVVFQAGRIQSDNKMGKIGDAVTLIMITHMS